MDKLIDRTKEKELEAVKIIIEAYENEVLKIEKKIFQAVKFEALSQIDNKNLGKHTEFSIKESRYLCNYELKNKEKVRLWMCVGMDSKGLYVGVYCDKEGFDNWKLGTTSRKDLYKKLKVNGSETTEETESGNWIDWKNVEYEDFKKIKLNKDNREFFLRMFNDENFKEFISNIEYIIEEYYKNVQKLKK